LLKAEEDDIQRVQGSLKRTSRPTNKSEGQNLHIKRFKADSIADPSIDSEEELKKSSQSLVQRINTTNPLNDDERHSQSFNDSSKYASKCKASSDPQLSFGNESEGMDLVEIYENKAKMLRSYIRNMIASFIDETKLPTSTQVRMKLKAISSECKMLLDLIAILCSNLGPSNNIC
jgi:hypothetical protein